MTSPAYGHRPEGEEAMNPALPQGTDEAGKRRTRKPETVLAELTRPRSSHEVTSDGDAT